MIRQSISFSYSSRKCCKWWAYQDYEIFGSKGRLWRTGDKTNNLFIEDGTSGGWAAKVDEEWVFKPVKTEDGSGPWHPVDIDEEWKEMLCSECHTGLSP